MNLLNRDNPRHGIQSFTRCLELNVHTAFFASRAVVETMIKQRKKGVIINVSSISAYGNAGQSAYSAAKSALIGLSNSWSKELGMFGIRANSIAPGFVDTNSTSHALNPSIIGHIVKNTPLRKMGNVNDICLAVEYIMKNDFVTGEVLRVDGGLRI